MKSVSWRAQLGFIAVGYVTVSVVAATLLFLRRLQELRYPVDASGGMWAAGDAFLYIFIVCLFMIPTVFLIWAIARFESIYITYSQALLGLSLTAPICLCVLSFGTGRFAQSVGFLCLFRLLWSPFILVGIVVSWLVARFNRARRLVSYALLVEGLTLALAVVLFIRSLPLSHR